MTGRLVASRKSVTRFLWIISVWMGRRVRCDEESEQRREEEGEQLCEDEGDSGEESVELGELERVESGQERRGVGEKGRRRISNITTEH